MFRTRTSRVYRASGCVESVPFKNGMLPLNKPISALALALDPIVGPVRPPFYNVSSWGHSVCKYIEYVMGLICPRADVSTKIYSLDDYIDDFSSERSGDRLLKIFQTDYCTPTKSLAGGIMLGYGLLIPHPSKDVYHITDVRNNHRLPLTSGTMIG